jgi:type IV pilus assembly protein PilV
MLKSYPSKASRGFTLIEVMVAIVILAVGLLGLALLQTNALNNQLEAYQRTQALLSLEDMSNRIRANAANARDGDYTDGSQYGLLAIEDCTVKAAGAPRDLCDWNVALAGTSVQLGGRDIGSIVGARGCIENLAGSSDGDLIVRLTIAWQGMSATVAPALLCGKDTFDAENKRRVASVQTVLADLAL